MRSQSHDRGSWSRRRFLALGLTASALVPVLPAAARARLAVRAPDPVPGPAQSTLTIASRERLTPALRAQVPGPLVLAGDRLGRLHQLHRLLRQDRPGRVLLRLDTTDQLMWDVALVDAGVTASPETGGSLRLVPASARIAEARA